MIFYLLIIFCIVTSQSMKKSQMGPRSYQAFDPTPFAVNGLTRAEVLQLKDAFDLLDVNGAGKLEISELKNLVKSFNFERKCLSIELAIQQLVDSKKGVDFGAFTTIFTAFYHGGNKRENINKIFKIFDDEKMGCISGKNLKRVINELGLQIDDNQVQQMIERADINNDGVITEDEFYLIMTKISSKV